MKRLVLAVMGIALLAACHGAGGTSAPPSPKASYDLAAVGQRYLGILKTENEAIHRAKRLPVRTLAEQRRYFRAISKIYSTAEYQVGHLQVPPSMLGDKILVVGAFDFLAKDARQGVSATTASAVRRVRALLRRDRGTEAASSFVFRTDLGLPSQS